LAPEPDELELPLLEELELLDEEPLEEELLELPEDEDELLLEAPDDDDELLVLLDDEPPPPQPEITSAKPIAMIGASKRLMCASPF
jgi:hypothetical protein